MKTILYINPTKRDVEEFYTEHSTYHEGDSGLDIFVPKTIEIEPNSVCFIDHDIRCEMVSYMPNPQMRGTMKAMRVEYDSYNETFLLLPRSSISKTPLIMCNSIGIIDGGYRGNIIGAVRNLSNEKYVVESGTRLFQLCAKNFEPFEFELTTKLSETVRGEDGFGSTGK